MSDWRHPNSLNFIVFIAAMFLIWLFFYGAYSLLRRCFRRTATRNDLNIGIADTSDLGLEEVPAFHRATMTAFLANIFGVGHQPWDFTNVSTIVSLHDSYRRMERIIDGVRDDLGLSQDLSVNEIDRLLETLLNDNTFITVCVYASDFLAHCVDTAHNVTDPEGQPINENLIPRDYVVEAYRKVYQYETGVTSV